MSPVLLKIEQHSIYNDLVHKFRDEGHNIYIMLPFERRIGKKTTLYEDSGVNILGVRTFNVTRSNLIEKGIGQILLEDQFKRAFKRYLCHIKFDVILYSTPPITFSSVIEYAKRINPQAVSYLMLKDIFPQNAVDIGMLKKTGVKGLFYHSFRKKEKQLYKVSDWIGCMSPANVRYVIKHNPDLDPRKVEICPNSYEVTQVSEIQKEEKYAIRKMYNLPEDKPILIYGGNLGKPQGIPFLIDCLKANKNRTDCHFVIIGNGTDYPLIEKFIKTESPQAISLFKLIPKEDFDKLIDACDVGLIFLDYRFTIPNYPSRLLPYLMKKKPLISVTDPNSDVGTIANDNGYGFWVPSNNVAAFTEAVNKMLISDIKHMGENGYQFYLNNYTVQHTYDAILKHVK